MVGLLRIALMMTLSALVAGCALRPTSVRIAASQVERPDEPVATLDQLGVYQTYDDPALEAYVMGVIERLAAGRPLGERQLTLRLVDASFPTATVGEGRLVSVTLGLLAMADDEAELAAVLAHELAHVELGHVDLTRREVAEILISGARSDRDHRGAYEALARARRQMETDADARGLEILAAAGYDASAFHRIMARLTRGAGRSRRPSYFDTHPSSVARLRELAKAEPGGDVNREAYLRAIDGLRFTGAEPAVVGANGELVSTSYGLALRPPRDYDVVQRSSAVYFINQDRRTLIYFTAAPTPTPLIGLEDELRLRLHRALANGGSGVGPLRDVRVIDSIGGRRAAVGLASIGEDGFEARIMLIDDERRRLHIVAFYPEAFGPAVGRAMDGLAESLRALSPREIDAAGRSEVRIETTRSGESVEEFLRRTGAEEMGEELFRAMNSLGRSGDALPGGRKVKTVAEP